MNQEEIKNLRGSKRYVYIMYVGFMRLVTLNWKLAHHPVEEGWRK